MPRRLLTEPKSQRMAAEIVELLKGQAYSAKQIALKLDKSVQFVADYLPALIDNKSIYHAGNERKGNLRLIDLYTASPELKRHPNETVRVNSKAIKRPQKRKERATVTPVLDDVTKLLMKRG